MTVWLCSWIGFSLFHGVSHVLHPDEHHAPCAVCLLFHHSAAGVIDTKLAVRVDSVSEYEREVRASVAPLHPQAFLLAAVSRGPPAPFLA